MRYNPFGEKSLDEITSDDLSILSEIEEGWFVEYKQEPCKPTVYAKEVSAFANARGGWLFIGLAEDDSRKPAGGPGLPVDQANQFRDSARDGIAQNLSPPPSVELRIIEGPVEKLSIPKDKCLLIVAVDSSNTAPHVHSNGKVYGRKHDAAQPISDRNELDRLVERSHRTRKRLSRSLDLGFDVAWSTTFLNPWLYCALVPEPPSDRGWKPLDFRAFEEAMDDMGHGGLSLPDKYSSWHGFVARNNRHQTDPSGPAPSLEFGPGGRFYINMPLSAGSVERRPDFLRTGLGRRFEQQLLDRGLTDVQVFDGSQIVTSIAGLGGNLKTIVERCGPANPTFASRIELSNVFRCVPFFESEAYVLSCENSSVPIIHHSTLRLPAVDEQWIKVSDIGNDRVSLILRVLLAIGVTPNVADKVLKQAITVTKADRTD